MKIKFCFLIFVLFGCNDTSSSEAIGSDGAVKIRMGGISENAEKYEDAANLIAENQYLKAEEIYNRLTIVEPNDESSWIGLASINSLLNRPELAVKYSKRALEVNPNSPFAYGSLGSAYSKQNKYTEAINNYRTAIKLNESIAETYWGLAVCYNNLKKLDSAKYFANIYLKKEPNSKYKNYFEEILRK